MQSGSYILALKIQRRITVRIGTLGLCSFDAATYIYVGSARSGIASRISRHIRLAAEKSGKIRWHIDYLLVHKDVIVSDVIPHPEREECEVSRQFAQNPSFSVPVPRFGASDCRNKCPAHLYKMNDSL